MALNGLFWPDVPFRNYSLTYEPAWNRQTDGRTGKTRNAAYKSVE